MNGSQTPWLPQPTLTASWLCPSGIFWAHLGWLLCSGVSQSSYRGVSQKWGFIGRFLWGSTAHSLPLSAGPFGPRRAVGPWFLGLWVCPTSSLLHECGEAEKAVEVAGRGRGACPSQTDVRHSCNLATDLSAHHIYPFCGLEVCHQAQSTLRGRG